MTEITLTYTRSSGPGGQNVNKVNSKAVLHWSAEKSNGLNSAQKARFLQQYAGRVDNSGYIVITSDRTRSRIQNRDDCLKKLRELILKIATAPRLRHKTKPSQGSVERRLKSKTLRSKTKNTRRKVRGEE